MFIWLRRGPKADSCEYGNEISGSIKGGNFLTKRGTISFSRVSTFHRVSYLREERRDDRRSEEKEGTMATCHGYLITETGEIQELAL
jgi:hypothetical protein